jgi:hypothetical protein
MRSKILTVLAVVAVMGVSPAAIAKGGGGGGGGGSHGGMHGGMHGMHGHGHFDHRFARRFFDRGLFNSFGWGWGGDWGWGGYGDSGYSGNNTVVAFPQATPTGVTGSVATGPCSWKQQEFTVPSSAGGTRPVQVVSCH